MGTVTQLSSLGTAGQFTSFSLALLRLALGQEASQPGAVGSLELGGELTLAKRLRVSEQPRTLFWEEPLDWMRGAGREHAGVTRTQLSGDSSVLSVAPAPQLLKGTAPLPPALKESTHFVKCRGRMETQTPRLLG